MFLLHIYGAVNLNIYDLNSGWGKIERTAPGDNMFIPFQIPFWAIIVFCIGLAIFLFGGLPQFQDTWLSRLRGQLLSGPHYMARLDDDIFEGNISRKLSSFWQAHGSKFGYIVPIGYTILVGRCLEIFFSNYYSLVSGTVQRYILIPFFAALPLASFAACTFVNPGEITKANHQRAMEMIPFDRIIFMPNTECSTCKFEKPARSKHCSTCNFCCMVADHHCIITNSCIGYRNYRWFLLFLFANIIMLGYGGWLLHGVVSRHISLLLEDRVNEPLKGIDPGLLQWRYWDYLLTASHYRNAIVLFALCVPIFVIVCGFLFIHLRYIYLGATTNEVAKWEMINDCIAEGTLYFYSTDNNSSQVPIVLQKCSDGRFNRALTDQERRFVQENRLELLQVRDHGDITNIYDQGFWNNLKFHLFPKCIDK